MTFNFFPEVLWLGSLLAPVLLRVGVSILLLLFAISHYRRRHEIQGKPHLLLLVILALELALSFLLFIGLYTQIAALIGIAYSYLFLFFNKRLLFLSPHSRSFYFLMALVLLTLFLTGAGPLAIDVPL